MTTQLTGFDLPASVKTIEKDFMWDSLDLRGGIYSGKGVKTIGEKAFAGCENLEIYVPSSVKKIGKKAFGKGIDGKHVKMLYCEKNSAAYRYAKKEPHSI